MYLRVHECNVMARQTFCPYKHTHTRTHTCTSTYANVGGSKTSFLVHSWDDRDVIYSLFIYYSHVSLPKLSIIFIEEGKHHATIFRSESFFFLKLSSYFEAIPTKWPRFLEQFQVSGWAERKSEKKRENVLIRRSHSKLRLCDFFSGKLSLYGYIINHHASSIKAAKFNKTKSHT